LYHSLGLDAVKTGYVTDLTSQGHSHWGQYMVRHYRYVIEQAAQYGIMLDVHEPIHDTGERRTYPNMMTREGARGQEYNAWGGGPPRELRAPACVSVHPRRGGRLGHDARARGEDRRLRRRGAARAQRPELVHRRDHGRGRANIRHPAVVPDAGSPLRRGDLRGRTRRALAHEPAAGRDLAARGYHDDAAARGPRARRRASDPNPTGALMSV